MVVLLIIILLIIAVLIYLLGRNDKVLYFRYYIADLSYEYNLRRIKELPQEYNDAYNWFANKWAYKQMLFSLKSLELENWFTKEELEEIRR